MKRLHNIGKPSQFTCISLYEAFSQYVVHGALWNGPLIEEMACCKGTVG